MENKIITKQQKDGIKIIKQLLNEMHKDIKELMTFENLEKDAKTVQEKSIRIAKIAITLQNTLDKKNGGDVAKNLDHLYKHIRYAVGRVMDDKDFSYLESAEKVTAEINKGLDLISHAAA